MAITLEQLQKAMDSFGDMKMRIEGMSSEKKTLMDEVINSDPAIRKAVQEIEEEFEPQEEKGKETLKQARKVLDSMIDSYLRENPLADNREIIASELMNLTAKAEVVWDNKKLENLILEGHTELLDCRSDVIKTVLRTKNV
jgi:hypothetical protein